MSILIKWWRVVDPKNNIDEILDIFIENSKISQVNKNLTVNAEKIIDAKWLVVTPWLIDLQVHLREPWREDKETLETWSKAALAWWVTSVVCMPNLNPVWDNQTVIEFIIKRSKELDLINIFPSWAITKNQDWEKLAEIVEMKNSWAIAVTDDWVDVQDEWLLKRALEYCKTFDMLVMSHCETEDLSEGWCMHEWWISTQMWLAWIPALSEDLAVYKNILLAEEVWARLHLLHNSTSWAVRAIREAKKRWLKNITAEATVQHFSLTDEECLGYNTNAKMYPPLRSRDHVNAIIEAIKDDTIDAFTTDHAPHIEPEKLLPFVDAKSWFVWLETSFAVMNTYLVKAWHIDLSKWIEKMTIWPAKIIRVNKWHLSIWADADISIFDLDKKWIVDEKKFFSKWKNSPYIWKELTWKAIYTIVWGKLKYDNGKIIC